MNAPKLFKVTFYNVLAARRGVVVDDLDETTAEAVRDRLSDPKDVHMYLPEVRVEQQVSEAA